MLVDAKYSVVLGVSDMQRVQLTSRSDSLFERKTPSVTSDFEMRAENISAATPWKIFMVSRVLIRTPSIKCVVSDRV